MPGSFGSLAPIRDGIAQTAQALGVSPVDLATAISYETAGTFDPLKRGPTTQWGQHRGLIQFGGPQARQHGVDWSDPIGSQLGPNGAIASYLRSTGVQPGMGLLDIYSAINAGGVGRYDRSDANNGGAPGTVQDKVEKQMAGHRAKAEALFSEDAPAASSAPEKTDMASAFDPRADMPAEGAAETASPFAVPGVPAGLSQGGGDIGSILGMLGMALLASPRGAPLQALPSLIQANERRLDRLSDRDYQRGRDEKTDARWKTQFDASQANTDADNRRSDKALALQEEAAKRVKPLVQEFDMGDGTKKPFEYDSGLKQWKPMALPGMGAANSALPPPPAGVDAGVWRKAFSERAAEQALPANADDVSGLRKEVQALPAYKNFAQAAPIYRGMSEAAGRNSKAADLNMVYGLGKIMDPTSVVREGEMVMVKNTASLPDWLQGAISQLNGGAALTPDTRDAIMKEAFGRVSGYQQEFENAVGQYRGIAERRKINPLDVIPDFGKFEPWQRPPKAASAGAPPASPIDRATLEAEARRRGLMK